MRQLLVLGCFLTLNSVLAEKAGVKLDGIETDEETSITIKKGAQATAHECTEYQIVEGKDEINGSPDFDRKKSYQDWKAECDKWKTHMKELNKENQILQLNCNKPRMTREGEQGVYGSEGTYKLKVKIKENKK